MPLYRPDSCTHCDCWFITSYCQADFSSGVLRGHAPPADVASWEILMGVGSTSRQGSNGQGNAVDTACSHHQAWGISVISQDLAGGQDKAGLPRRSLKPHSAQNAILSFPYPDSYSKFTKCMLLRTMPGETDK